MLFLMLNVLTVGAWWNSLKTTLKGIAHNAKHPFRMTVRIMGAINGVIIRQQGMGTPYALNSNGQRIDSTDIIFDCRYPFAFVKSNLEN